MTDGHHVMMIQVEEEKMECPCECETSPKKRRTDGLGHHGCDDVICDDVICDDVIY